MFLLPQHPWMAAIILDQGNGNFQIHCTGSIVSSWNIISAGHCFNDPNIVPHLKIFLGSADPELRIEMGRKVKDISDVTTHHDYVEGVAWFNIAVIQLTEEIDFTEDPDQIYPLCLPRHSYPKDTFVGAYAMIVGYGTVSSVLDDKSDV